MAFDPNRPAFWPFLMPRLRNLWTNFVLHWVRLNTAGASFGFLNLAQLLFDLSSQKSLALFFVQKCTPVLIGTFVNMAALQAFSPKLKSAIALDASSTGIEAVLEKNDHLAIIIPRHLSSAKLGYSQIQRGTSVIF